MYQYYKNKNTIGCECGFSLILKINRIVTIFMKTMCCENDVLSGINAGGVYSGPGVYCLKCCSDPAFIWDPAFIRDPATIRNFTVCHIEQMKTVFLCKSRSAIPTIV